MAMNHGRGDHSHLREFLAGSDRRGVSGRGVGCRRCGSPDDHAHVDNVVVDRSLHSIDSVDYKSTMLRFDGR